MDGHVLLREEIVILVVGVEVAHGLRVDRDLQDAFRVVDAEEAVVGHAADGQRQRGREAEEEEHLFAADALVVGVVVGLGFADGE